MSNRFRADRAKKIVAALKERGVDAWTTAPYKGCECCSPPHKGVTRDGEPMLSVISPLTDKHLHRFAVEIGVIMGTKRPFVL